MDTTDYEKGDVHDVGEHRDPDRHKWLLLYALTLMTVILSAGVSITAYRQGQDRAQVQVLAEGNRKITCQTQEIRFHTTPQTDLERKYLAYFRKHPVQGCH